MVAHAVVRLADVHLRYGAVVALQGVSLTIPAGTLLGVIGPDGVGKSSALAVMAGVRAPASGQVEVLGADLRQARQRQRVGPRIAYMPQGLGRNLYPTLSVAENLQFFGRVFGHDARTCQHRIDVLTRATDLYAFRDRPAGKLSGGMKQKLGLCCALIHDPDLLILDEPTTGVDPLARSQFWALIARLRAERPTLTVVVATAYMDEAEAFDTLVAMNGGGILAQGTPQALRAATGTTTLEAAYRASLPDARRGSAEPLVIPPPSQPTTELAIEAHDLTLRFGDFVAVSHVSLQIRRGEIFGFLGSNGCGKTTTMKMLTGLLPASAGSAVVFGEPLVAHARAVRRRVGYMSQSFSLYGELTVRQNLRLHAQLFGLSPTAVQARSAAMLQRFELTAVADSLPADLPLGVRQRLSLAVALVHQPELLILDEPTSGVDPIARDVFWQHLMALSRQDGVTLFISTHFMNEAARCDRISLMHAGRILATGTPAQLMAERGAATLDAAFVAWLTEAAAATQPATADDTASSSGAAASAVPMDKAARLAPPTPASTLRRHAAGFRWQRLWATSWRESLELKRDPVRATLALLGSLVLLVVMGYGINLDVDDLRFAVLDWDQSAISRDYTLNLAGSRYFLQAPSLRDGADMEQRLRAGELALAIEIPPGFGRDVVAGRPTELAAWIDGAMPSRAETVRGYVQGMHQHWLTQRWPSLAPARPPGATAAGLEIQTRFRYNPDVASLPAMVPAVIPLLLLMLPAMLTALAVVREKELGSITNFYVTPLTRTEFLLGKQLPYVGLAMLNFALMTVMAVTVFDVPLTGNLPALTLGALLYSLCATAMGLLASAATRSQVAAIFFTMIGTLIPAAQFSGLIDPVASLEGVARWVGEAYPATHMFLISRGVFNKALGVADLAPAFWALALALPVIWGLAIVLLRKQEA